MRPIELPSFKILAHGYTRAKKECESKERQTKCVTQPFSNLPTRKLTVVNELN